MPRKLLAAIGALVATATFSSTIGVQPVAGGDAQVAGAEARSSLVTPVLSPRRVPEFLASARSDAEVRAALQPLVDEALPNTCIVVTDHGRVILDHGPDVLEPASTVKILTAKAVLDRLDPDSRLRTTVAAPTAPSNGVVDGDLYLVGGGDPLLTTPGYEVSFINRDQLKNDFARLADAVVEAGVREVRGDVVGDDSRYDTERWVPSWPTRYQNQGFIGPLSALMVNDGQTGYSTSPETAATRRLPGDPPLLAAETLLTMLEDRGVLVGGGPSAGRAPDGVSEIAGLDSLTIRELVGQMLIESDDTTAELLTKELGLQVNGTGSTTVGTTAITDHLAAEGFSLDGLQLNDGSGLDEGNRVNCHLLSAILDREGPDSAFAQLLPIAAENGTLRPRMRRTPAQGRVAAKTGTLDFVNALAGYAQAVDGSWLTFVYTVVGTEQPRGYVPLDEFAIGLVGLPGQPNVEQLAPKDP